jgi:hypothetical protein
MLGFGYADVASEDHVNDAVYFSFSEIKQPESVLLDVEWNDMAVDANGIAQRMKGKWDGDVGDRRKEICCEFHC